MSEEGEKLRVLGRSLLDPRIIDPRQEMVDYSALSEEEIAQIVQVLSGIRNWRETEERVSLRSRNHMHLNETDMKALRFIIASANAKLRATPGAIAEHLGISSASTTKLLDRLERAGHIERSPHPSDRRALIISITADTHKQVRETIGHRHARRFEVAATMTASERATVIRFLEAMSNTDEDPQP